MIYGLTTPNDSSKTSDKILESDNARNGLMNVTTKTHCFHLKTLFRLNLILY